MICKENMAHFPAYKIVQLLSYFAAIRTFREKRRNGEAECYGGEDVEKEKDEDDGRAREVDDRSVVGLHVKYDRDDDDGDEHENAEFDEPGQPVKPRLHSHQLHRLLRFRKTFRIKYSILGRCM